MKEKTDLYILWTNANPLTAEKMVFIYAVNSKLKGWWDNVTIIIWGATAKLVGEDLKIQNLIKEALEIGVNVTACKACVDQLGMTDLFEDLNIEVIYWGEPLTKILKNQETLITV